MLDLDLKVQRGGFRLEVMARVARGPLVVVGPNGAGKSTLLKALAGALTAEGSQRVAGRELNGLTPEKRRVGYLPQGLGLFPHLSVRANVAFGAPDPAACDAQLTRWDLRALADRSVGGLSGGEAQRVALARALATAPTLLLLDEPTSALDVRARVQARALLREVFDEVPTIIVTHDVLDLRAWAPWIWVVEQGALVAEGALDDVLHDPFVRALVGA